MSHRCSSHLHNFIVSNNYWSPVSIYDAWLAVDRLVIDTKNLLLSFHAAQLAFQVTEKKEKFHRVCFVCELKFVIIQKIVIDIKLVECIIAYNKKHSFVTTLEVYNLCDCVAPSRQHLAALVCINKISMWLSNCELNINFRSSLCYG